MVPRWQPTGRQHRPRHWGPHCPANKGPSCEAQIWLFDEAGGEPVLLHALRAPPSAYIEESDVLNPPMLTNLAWSPDGQRLGLISTTYYGDRADPPTLVALDVETGRTETRFEFAVCDTCYPVSYGYAWSPDQTRLAVSSGEGIAPLSVSDGTSSSRQAAAAAPGLAHRPGGLRNPAPALGPPIETDDDPSTHTADRGRNGTGRTGGRVYRGVHLVG